MLDIATRATEFGVTYLVRSMYDSKYMSHIVGNKNKSIFLTSFFSSSGVHVRSPVTSICFVVSISF
jgi:hypothetical protein